MSVTQKLLRFGVFELNLDTEVLRKDGIPLKLPPQPFKILVLMASRAGQLITREEIQKQVWGDETYVDFEHGLNQCIKQIRTVLNDNTDRPVYVETVPRRGYRFLAPVVSKTVPAPPARVVESTSGIAPALAGVSGPRPEPPQLEPAMPAQGVSQPGSGSAVAVAKAPAAQSEAATTVRRRIPWFAFLAGGLLLAALIVSWLYWSPHKVAALTEKDTVVLADFANATGDPVFDDTLAQALTIQLQQSPFLNLLSSSRIAQTLSLMEQPKDARLTPELAREVCQRTGSAATIEGSISTLGKQYVLSLRAVSCRKGDLLANWQETATGKEHVLDALGAAATKLRKRLGESLASVQKFDVSAENVTTPSLEALQAYGSGYRAMVVKNDYPAAIPWLQRAIGLDPNFAMAYARLATSYSNQGQTARAAENLRKAYELRDRVSERERYYIDSHYKQMVTGNLEAARNTYELWTQTYPRDLIPPNNLGNIYVQLGEPDKALAAFQTAFELDPSNGLSYGNMVEAYLYLNRLEEAKATAREAQAHNLDSPSVHENLYLVDFLQHDEAGMEHEAKELVRKPGIEDILFEFESNTAVYAGRFATGRELTRRAVNSAQRADKGEEAAAYQAMGAVREALAGNLAQAKRQAESALALSNGKEVKAAAAIALALAGDLAKAKRVADDLAGQFPEDTIVQFNYLPTIRAAVALKSDDPANAIETLSTATPYELGITSENLTFALYPVYFRGEAYLAAHQGEGAATEFQKILDHPGMVVNQLIGALARLQLARAQLMMGDTENARKSYQDFLALWKDADQDIPILKQAKAEYGRLPRAG